MPSRDIQLGRGVLAMAADRYRIRRYRPPDRNDVWRVHDRAFRSSPMTFLPEYNRELRHIEESYLDVGGEFLVVELSGDPSEQTAVVGCGGFLPTLAEGATHGPDAAVSGGSDTVELRSIRVDPTHQRRGIGRELVLDLEARAVAAGFECVLVETVEALTGAVGLYESLGYEIRDRIEEDDRTRITFSSRLPREG